MRNALFLSFLLAVVPASPALAASEAGSSSQDSVDLAVRW